MPPPKYLQPNYLGAMDQSSYFEGLDAFGPTYSPTNHPQEGFQPSGLTPSDLGTTANPMQNQLQELQAKIKMGVNKLELGVWGRGKGSAQQPTPESYSAEERLMMRKLAEINKIKTSTHAAPSVQGLAGVSERGFSRQAQDQTVKEVQKAIDFAKDASTGGAVVVHVGEWQRPINHYYGDGSDKAGAKFKQWHKEEEEESFLVADAETGEFVQNINKRGRLELPKYQTAKDLLGVEEPRQGEDLDGNTVTIHPDDFVTLDGKKIDETNPDHLFRRVPKWDSEKARFETETLTWDKIVERANEYNQKYGDQLDKKLKPEEYYAQLTFDNQILQARGSSLFHARQYDELRESYDDYKQLLKKYQELGEGLSEEEKRELMGRTIQKGELLPPEKISTEELIKKKMEGIEKDMRYIHESSSSADARAKEMEDRRRRLKTIEEVGLQRTGEALGRLGLEAMEKSAAAKKMRGKDEKFEDIYIAPENMFPGEYGGHPAELLEIVKAGRKSFVEQAVNQHKMSEEQAQALAKKHIKTTIDIGHLNLWRSLMEKKPGESEQAFQKRFDTWMEGHLEELHKEEAIGHLHLTDNFGYGDEHLTPGQGNAPIKKFVDWMQDKGYKDFIVEVGSFNANSTMFDTWAFLGAAPWKSTGAGRQSFQQLQNAQAGLYAPPNYIVGAYVPSNEWTLWTGVPLE